ncbi:acyl-CoA dehydrogenase-like (plasmid) [Azospirillum sp. B510]|nr:acyl-CoA dehydrogenase-like [Azospirillum sp. B510]
MNGAISADLDALDDETFRGHLRTWLETYYPQEYRQDHRRPFRRLRGADHLRWLRLLHEHGWRAPAWPREYGGLGLSLGKQLIHSEEFERIGVARVIDLGEAQLGPVLMYYGTDEQKRYYLPRILSGEHVWCQGYSEPNAGSDLASLRTKADRDGEHFVVNGQKIWTTHANDATHIFLLVRTGRYEKKQQGISFILVDLKTPGITVRPINNLAGEDEFCEVFFDDVRVPVANLVGELDKGWSVAKTLLGHERIWLGSPALAGKALALAERLVEEMGLADDPATTDRLAELAADMHDYRRLYADICDLAARGGELGPEVSALKIFVSELLQRITEFNVDVVGERGGVIGDIRVGNTIADLHWQFMMARPVTIFGGTNEVQRDIMARAVLGMGVGGSRSV